VTTLAGVGILTINGCGVGLTESPQAWMTLRKTNLTTLSCRSWSWSVEAVPDALVAARTGLVTATFSIASMLTIWPWG
jgi:hypothetical protein